MARRCRWIIQACLREDEWGDADLEFYLVIREGLERFVEARGANRTAAATRRVGLFTLLQHLPEALLSQRLP